MMLPVTAINATTRPTVRPTERCSQKINLRRVIVSDLPTRLFSRLAFRRSSTSKTGLLGILGTDLFVYIENSRQPLGCRSRTSSGASPKRQLEEVLLPSQNTTDLVLFQSGQASVIFPPVSRQCRAFAFIVYGLLELRSERAAKHSHMKGKTGNQGQNSPYSACDPTYPESVWRKVCVRF